MQVGLVIYGSLGSVSGGYLYDRQLVRYLEGQGEQVHIVNIPWRKYAWHLVDNASKALYSQLKHLKVEILLQDELNHPSLFLVNSRLKRSASYPIITIVHHLRSSEYHSQLQKRLYAAVEKRYLQNVDGYIFNSRDTQHQVENLVGEVGSYVVARPAGDRLHPELPPGWTESRAMQAGPVQILFLGNVIPRKGFHTLLEALRSISAEDWHLSVAGSLDFDVKYAQHMRSRVQSYQLGHKIRFLGLVDESDLDKLMLSCHLLVVPSYHEGFGIAYLEGMGYGLPAIGTFSGGAPEIISHGENGFLVKGGDASALSGYISRLINDRGLLLKLSQGALEHYANHPSWEDSMARIHTYLKMKVYQDKIS